MARAKKAEAASQGLANVVNEMELAAYLTAKVKITELNRQAKALKEENDEREATILKKLKAGGTVLGKIQAFVIKEMPACRPAWKEEFETLARKVGLIPAKEVEKVQAKVKEALEEEDKLVVVPPDVKHG